MGSFCLTPETSIPRRPVLRIHLKQEVIISVGLFALLLFSSFQNHSSYLTLPVKQEDPNKTARFALLKKTTEEVFEVKKDSFEYHKDYVTQEEGRSVKIYSMVWVGKIFNPFDRQALIAYSLNDSMLYVEVRHQIGKVWVHRFQYTSNVSKSWDKLQEPVLIMEGEHAENVLFIASKNGLSVYKGINGDKWIYSKGSFKKLNE
jgi:hypothetical protein